MTNPAKQSQSDETIERLTEVGERVSPKKNEKIFLKIGVAIAGTATIAALAYGAGRSVGGINEEESLSEQPEEEVSDSDEIEGVTPYSPERFSSESTESNQQTDGGVDHNQDIEDHEAMPPDMEPKLMTAATPRGLLEEFQHNMECLANSRHPEIQTNCRRHLTGDRVGNDELTWSLENLAADMREYREIVDPNYSINYTAIDIIDSTISQNETIAENIWEIGLIVNERYADGRTAQFYLEFNRGALETVTSPADEIAEVIERTDVWLLRTRIQTEDVSVERFLG